MAGPPPLTGLKVLEFAGLAPGPFAGLLLADSGASVLRIDRAHPTTSHRGLFTNKLATTPAGRHATPPMATAESSVYVVFPAMSDVPDGTGTRPEIAAQ